MPTSGVSRFSIIPPLLFGCESCVCRLLTVLQAAVPRSTAGCSASTTGCMLCVQHVDLVADTVAAGRGRHHPVPLPVRVVPPLPPPPCYYSRHSNLLRYKYSGRVSSDDSHLRTMWLLTS
ncbi:hypothetical protein HF086_010519 [Spodoptera exigua]|uniref:Uncharacterized protein n=1 Tax=Spodoptera exigua TaxID=7107 RepID=A0A922MTC9_SPOEX|nr:hypothetical protein HF086_010519 [Spodoptera exigua]